MRKLLFSLMAMVGVFLYAQNDTTYIYKGNSVNEDSPTTHQDTVEIQYFQRNIQESGTYVF